MTLIVGGQVVFIIKLSPCHFKRDLRRIVPFERKVEWHVLYRSICSFVVVVHVIFMEIFSVRVVETAHQYTIRIQNLNGKRIVSPCHSVICVRGEGCVRIEAVAVREEEMLVCST